MEKSFLQNLAEEAELNVRSYSGRGMYKKECLGIDCNSLVTTFATLLEVLAENHFDEGSERGEAASIVSELAEALRGSRVDNMGLGVIVYFPDIPFVKDDDDDDDLFFTEQESAT